MLILLGPPGAGKGTQARIFSERLGVKHLSAGDSLKINFENDKEIMNSIHSGKIVDNIKVNSFILNLINTTENLEVLEGFPRTELQCNYILNNLKNKKISGVVILEVDKETILSRLCKRYVCSLCQKSERERVICCELLSVKRIDDQDINTVERRRNVFEEGIKKIKEVFIERNIKICLIDGSLSKELVWEKILSFYKSLTNKSEDSGREVND